jgi:hypothetical protein
MNISRNGLVAAGGEGPFGMMLRTGTYRKPEPTLFEMQECITDSNRGT